MDPKTHLNVRCDACGHSNKVPTARLYDGFEGIFLCTKCKQALNNLHEMLDEE